MTDLLTPARFAELADAYGGVVARWPEAVRVQAADMARNPALNAILRDAERLDGALDEWRVAAPPFGLGARILAARQVTLIRRARLWWSGIGMATALAGAIAGSVGVAVTVPADRLMSDEATVFGDLGPQEH